MPASVSTEAAKPRRARKKGDTAFWMRELKGIVAIVLALFGLIALSVFDPAVAPPDQHSVVGPVGVWLGWAFFRAFGYAGFLLPLLLGVWGLSAFLKPLVARGWVPIAGLAVLLVAATGLLQQTSDTFAASAVTRGGVVAAGGFIGWGVSTGLHTAIGNVGAWLLLVAAVPAGVLLVTQASFTAAMRLLSIRLARVRRGTAGTPALGPKAAVIAAAVDTEDTEEVEPPPLVVMEPRLPK